MCVAALAFDAHPRWRLAVLGNRDEYHARPTAPLGQWDNGIVAGRDLQAGGTWLGVSQDARFALVTNFRVPGYPKPQLASRGGLVTDWLLGREPDGIEAMNPFNLFVCDAAAAWHVTNYPLPTRRALQPGIHGLSNGGFDDRWPKTLALEAALESWLACKADDPEPLLDALANRRTLPGPGPESRFAPVFIADPVYGTRCSTVVLIDHAGRGLIVERRFDSLGAVAGETTITLPATA